MKARPSASSGGLTITEALATFEEQGFTGQFVVRGPDAIQCHVCGQTRSPEDVSLLDELRIEGESDPADEAVVAAMECPCGAKGTEVFTYGPAGSPEEEAVFARLHDARQSTA